MTKVVLPGQNTAGQPGGYAALDGAGGLLVPAYLEAAQVAAPAAPAAGKTRLFVDSNGLLQLLPATGGSRRVAAHWGSGTVFPTAGSVAAGDTFLRTDVGTAGTLYQYTGNTAQGVGGWIAEGLIVATSATRPAAAAVYPGAQLYETDSTLTWCWTGAAGGWVPVGAGPWTSFANGTYSWGLPSTFGQALPAIQGGASASFTVTVPIGKTLEVEFAAPSVTVAINTNAYLRIVDSVAGALDGVFWSTNSTTSITLPTRMRGVAAGDNLSHTVTVQGWLTSGAVTVGAASGASIALFLRYRLT